MKQSLIAGIGNPEAKYNDTWHNLGVNFIDYFAEYLAAHAKDGAKILEQAIKSEPITKIRLVDNTEEDLELLLYRSSYYMNHSGEGIAKLMSFLKIGGNDLILCYDDLDIKLGETKLQWSKHPREHNGVNSVIASLTEKEFYHLRLGVNTPERARFSAGSDYVLSKISAENKTAVTDSYATAAQKTCELLNLQVSS